jgi:vancomycin permeability regulator SanA
MSGMQKVGGSTSFKLTSKNLSKHNNKWGIRLRNYKHVLIVLGCAPRRDGKPSECMIARLRKAIQLYRKDNPSVVLFSGGPTRYGVSEAAIMRVMALNHLPH